MPTIGAVQKKIAAVEGFQVRFLYEGPGPQAGRDVRDDRQDIPGYAYQRAAKGDWTVAIWVASRFKAGYPGFDAVVLLGDNSVADGRMHLANVRDTY